MVGKLAGKVLYILQRSVVVFNIKWLLDIKMNITIKVFFVILANLLLVACFVGDEGTEEKIVGSYYIRGASGLFNVHIGFEDKEYGGIGLIEAPVTAIGYNGNYIIAKQGVEENMFYILKV